MKPFLILTLSLALLTSCQSPESQHLAAQAKNITIKVGESEELRRDIYAFCWQLGRSSENINTRTLIVEFMLERTLGETQLLRGQLLKWLQDFRKEDFNNNAKSILRSLPWSPDFSPEVIRLIGIADLVEIKPKLLAQASSELNSVPSTFDSEAINTWAALLALSRLGDTKSLDKVLELVKKEEDIILRSTVLFYDLGYTLQPQAFELLKKYLNSDKRLPRVKDNVPGQQEASHAAAVFSMYIPEFPIKDTDFNEKQLDQVRIWLNSRQKTPYPKIKGLTESTFEASAE